MARRSHRSAADARLLAVLLVGAIACGDETNGPLIPSGGPLRVSLTVDPASIHPGDRSVVTAGADLPTTQTLTRFDVAVSGFGSDTVFNLPIVGPGPLAYRLDIHVPH